MHLPHFLGRNVVMEKVNGLEGFFKSFEKPASWYVELGGYLIAGFIFGFLLKHGGRFFFMLLLGAALALWALDTLNVVTIHYSVMKSVFGLSADTSIQDAWNLVSLWIRTHVIESLSALFGFIIAWKLA